MPIDILMPALSPTMEEGTLAKWLVKEGDTVESGSVLAEIETDKATMELESIDEGTVGKILVEGGTTGVKVNQTIAILLEEGEELQAAIEKLEEKAEKEGIPANSSAEKNDVQTATADPDISEFTRKNRERIFASPLARRIAKEKNIDLAAISGSGPHGRIVKADVEKAPQIDTAKTAAPVTVPPTPPSVATIKKIYENREFEEVPLDGMRKTVAARLTESKQTVPHFYLRRDIRMDSLIKARSDLNKALAEDQIKLSINDFIIKACAKAMQAEPDANAIWGDDRILKFKNSDVAVAVAIEGGLFTPVITDAESKSIVEISLKMKDLAARARTRSLAPAEYLGGSFAISNLGMYGIENFDAVINPPHGSILAVGNAVKKPVVANDGGIEVAAVMSVTLSVDHRVIDGAVGARFLASIVRHLENPLLLLI